MCRSVGREPARMSEQASPGAVMSEGRRLSLLSAGDRLHLKEVLHAVLAPLATVAGLLVAAERGGALVRNAVEVDHDGTDLPADALGAFDRAGGDVAGEAVGRVVGNLDRFGLVLSAEDGNH